MFIRTENFNEYVNTDAIVSLRAKPSKIKGMEDIYATMRDGTVIELDNSNGLEALVSQMMPIVPAAPGYEALWIVHYDDEPTLGVFRHPVIGWRINPFGGMLPVTCDEEETASNVEFGGVKYPDGRVVMPDVAMYPNEEEWLKAMQEQDLKRRAAKAVA